MPEAINEKKNFSQYEKIFCKFSQWLRSSNVDKSLTDPPLPCFGIGAYALTGDTKMEQFLPLCLLPLSFSLAWSRNKMLRFGRVISVVIISCSFGCLSAVAQDTPRFEVGAGFTALHTAQRSSNLGPSVDGVYNFARFFSIDGTFTWYPHNASSTNFVQGQFGGKAGYRFQHFGIFGKVRPGFVSFGNVLRAETLTPIPLQPPLTGIGFFSTFRTGRLTEKTLDLGGVFEYYPAKHWSFRYEMGDTLLFTEPIKLNIIASPSFLLGPNPFFQGRTTNNFQIGTGIHYRF